MKERIQGWPRRAPLQRCLEGGLHLAGDLPFPDDQAVEARGHAEQVPRSFGVASLDEVRTKVKRGHAVERAEKIGQRGGVGERFPGGGGEV